MLLFSINHFFVIIFISIVMKKNVVVIFGGKSTEHDISILTSFQVRENIDKTKYNVIPVYIDKSGKWWIGEKLNKLETFKQFKANNLSECAILPDSQYLYIKKFNHYKKHVKINFAFLCNHGKNGEDGTLQGLLELSNITYSSSSVLASSNGIDKISQKRIFESLSLPVVPYLPLSKVEYEAMNNQLKIDSMAFPLIVKPNSLGSSIGVSICKNQKQLKQALDLAFCFDDTVIIEMFIKKLKEVNISVLGNSQQVLLSQTEQPLTKDKFLTFNEKYCKGKKNKKITNKIKPYNKLSDGGLNNMGRIMPAKITQEQDEMIKTYSTIVFKQLKCKGVIRIDYIIDQNDETLYINEVNTIPGSFANYLWKDKGYDFTALLDEIIKLCEQEKQLQEKLKLTFESNVL